MGKKEGEDSITGPHTLAVLVRSTAMGRGPRQNGDSSSLDQSSTTAKSPTPRHQRLLLRMFPRAEYSCPGNSGLGSFERRNLWTLIPFIDHGALPHSDAGAIRGTPNHVRGNGCRREKENDGEHDGGYHGQDRKMSGRRQNDATHTDRSHFRRRMHSREKIRHPHDADRGGQHGEATRNHQES